MRYCLSRRSVWIALVLTGCAQAPPPLPADTTSINRTHDLTIEDFTPEARAMSCEDIAAEWRKNADAMKTANGMIEANRTRNQIAGYFAALYLVPVVFTVNNDKEKDEITQLYDRRDTLIKLAALKHCSAPTP